MAKQSVDWLLHRTENRSDWQTQGELSTSRAAGVLQGVRACISGVL